MARSYKKGADEIDTWKQRVCESIKNEDVTSNDKIEYENMPDLIDPTSEEILDVSSRWRDIKVKVLALGWLYERSK